MALVVFLASLLPGAAYLWLVYRLDKYEPEPKGWVALVFFMGMAGAVLAAALHQVLDQSLREISILWAFSGSPWLVHIRYFGLVSPLEEGLKFLAFAPAFFNRRLFNEPVDGLVYAAAAALGFASLENALYALEIGPELIFWRAVLAVPAHLFSSAAWGLGLAFQRLVRGGKTGLCVAAASVAAAVLCHGLYDLLVHTRGAWAGAVLILCAGGVLAAAVRRMRKRSPFRTSILAPEDIARRAACPSCGSAGTVGERCPECKVALIALSHEDGRPPVRLPWLFLSAILLSGATAGVVFFGQALSLSTQNTLLVAGAAVLLGSVAVARLSPGITVAEPAVAGMVATVTFVLVGGNALGPALLLSPLGLVLAVLGAWLGERWQALAQGS